MTDPRPLVRVATAGSVDDGKSTFIGRLLHDCNSILDDQLEAVERASKQSGEDSINLALLTDGLRAERSQKITIDVAYRPFATKKRRFLLADTPGHAQYTRNMFTGASTAEVAILLIDAERGPTPQSFRHLFLTSLLRVPHVLVAINKIDLVGYRQDIFETWVGQLREHIAKLEFSDVRFAPISALEGEGVATYSGRMPWYSGPSVLDYLDDVELGTRQAPHEFRFPVQLVVRPDRSLRAVAGQVVSGAIREHEEVKVLPGGQVTRVARIRSVEGIANGGSVGEPVMIELADEIDVGRGAMLVRPGNPASVTHRIEAMVCAMREAPLLATHSYRILHTTRDLACEIECIAYRINPETLHREEVAELGINEIGRIIVRSSEPLCVDLYRQNRATGSLVLIDTDTNEVAAAGVITRILEGSALSAEGQRGLVVWMTGLSGSGKSTISDLAAAELRRQGRTIIQLDGDALRTGLNRDLGFGVADRTENIRRCAEVARLLSEQGAIVICSLISPMRTQRELARSIVGAGFLEVFVSCPIETLKERDPKGLYARAIRGEIPDFTGISAPYEEPETPQLLLSSALASPLECASELVATITPLLISKQ